MVEVIVAILGHLITFVGLSLAMRHMLGFTWEGILVVMFPTVLLMALAAVYGMHMRWEQHYRRYDRRRAAAPRVSELLLFASGVLLLFFAALYLMWQGHVLFAVVFAIAQIVLLAVGLIRFSYGLSAAKRATRAGEPGYHVPDGGFERGFRIFVFGLTFGLPAGLSLLFLALRDIEVAVVMGILAAVVAPFTLKRIAAERRRGRS